MGMAQSPQIIPNGSSYSIQRKNDPQVYISGRDQALYRSIDVSTQQSRGQIPSTKRSQKKGIDENLFSSLIMRPKDDQAILQHGYDMAGAKRGIFGKG